MCGVQRLGEFYFFLIPARLPAEKRPHIPSARLAFAIEAKLLLVEDRFKELALPLRED